MNIIKKIFFLFLNLISLVLLYVLFNKYVLYSYKYVAQRIASLILRRDFRKSGSISAKFPLFVSGLENVEVGDGFRAEKNLRIEVFSYRKGQVFKPKVFIGKNVSINENFHLGCIDYISIGNNVLIASNVFISDHAHGDFNPSELLIAPVERRLITKGPVRIGDNVWIGEGVSILPGVEIGNNSIVGANSVVTKSIPNNVVAAGVPAKIIKEIVFDA